MTTTPQSPARPAAPPSAARAGHDPAVLSWRIALAPRPAYRAGRHWWREYVTEAFRNAQAHRLAMRESGHDHGAQVAGGSGSVVAGHQLEDDQFNELYPAPRLKDFLVGLSQGRHDPYVTWEAPQH